jgi:hypothetical protein
VEGDLRSRDRLAVLGVAYRGALKVCDGRREKEGESGREKEEETGDLKNASLGVPVLALTGVAGEAIDPAVVGEGTTVVIEEMDSGIEDSELC